MQKRKFDALLIDADNRSAKMVSVNEKLSEYYKLLDCEYIDIASYKIGSKYFDFICDDDGFASGKNPTVLDVNNTPVLVGSVLICNSLETDEGIVESSLTSDDVKLIQKYLKAIKVNGKITPVIKVNEELLAAF
ncbi:hypothetical protein [Lactobacillus sp.]|uniref:hypothetical protein n=1 Tax=Lactobacillus sp. TaxID=1591 RepID=UPI0019B520FE|nr:hypothetical protein [Lactobacillus sp.]MBD5430483.1 hypothetical protein [Lactobacillus sp.]MBD5430777.1 hypothetical protein [Lactobacillus sp.]